MGIDGNHHGAWSFVAHVLLIDAWGVTTDLSWNVPSWSISAEWFAYLLAPPLFLRLLPRRPALHCGVVLIAIAALGIAEASHPQQQLNWTGVIALIRVSSEFSLGVVIVSWSSPRAGRRHLLAATAGALFLGGLLGGSDVLVVLGTALGLRVLYEWPVDHAGQLLVRLGEWSYGMYLVHTSVIIVLHVVWSRVPHTPLTHWAFFVATMMAITAAGMLLHRWVEVPSRTWLHDHVITAAVGPVAVVHHVPHRSTPRSPSN